MYSGPARDLKAFGESMSRICALATEQMELATRALLRADLDHAEQLLAATGHLDALADENHDRGLELLVRHAPVARNLRQVVTSIQLVRNIRRMGKLAEHVAVIARRAHPHKAFPEEMDGHFARMSTETIELGFAAAELLHSVDTDRALNIEARDDVVDELHSDLYSELTDDTWRWPIATAVNVALLSRYYERFADHAVTIAEQVLYLATGERRTPAKNRNTEGG